jgi:hypothetical protein
MKKIVPAVFFGKQTNDPTEGVRRPPGLVMFEERLRSVFGGLMRIYTYCYDSEGRGDVDDVSI